MTKSCFAVDFLLQLLDVEMSSGNGSYEWTFTKTWGNGCSQLEGVLSYSQSIHVIDKEY